MGAQAYNPNRPSVLGVEWPPLLYRESAIAADTEVGYSFDSRVAETVSSVGFYNLLPIPSGHRQHVLATVYPEGQEGAQGLVSMQKVACNGGSLSGASLEGGAASIAAALADPADAGYVGLNGFDSVALQFATAGLFTGKRILKLELEYLISAFEPTGVLTFPAQLLTLVQTLGNVNYGYVRGDDITDGGAAIVRVVNLGEINPASPTVDPYTTAQRWPWSVADVQLLDTTTLQLQLAALSSTSSLYYCALRVWTCDENRVAVGATILGAKGGATGDEPATVGIHTGMALRTPTGSSNWSKPSSGRFTVTLVQADAGGPFHGASNTENLGPPIVMPSIDSLAVFDPHPGVIARRRPDLSVLAVEATSELPYASLLVGGNQSIDSHGYLAQLGEAKLPIPALVYSGVGSSQEIVKRSGGGSVAYPWVRFWARRHREADAALTVTVGAATATITAAELDALPEILAGWRFVTLRFASPPSIDNAGGNQSVAFSSSAAQGNAWEILGAADLTFAGAAGYEGTAAAGTEQGTRRDYSDLAVHLATAPPVPAGLTTAQAAIAAGGFTGIECSVPAACIPTGIGYVAVSWTATSVTGFGYYEVERKDALDSTFRAVARITNQATPTFADFEARIGILSTYRVRVVRLDGIEGDPSSEATFTLAETATTSANGILLFTSNAHPAASLAYVESYDGSPVQEFEFVEAQGVTFRQFYGRDYQAGFHGTERGGVRFTRTLLVNNAIVAARTADRGFSSLRDLAWEALPYVCVRDDQGNRWLATVRVPSGSVSRRRRLYLAQVEVTESTVEPYPVDRATP